LLRRLALITTKKGSLSKRMLGSSPRVPLPSKVIERSKTGFGTPIQAWLQDDRRIQKRQQGPHTPCRQVCLGEALGLRGERRPSGSMMAQSSLRVLALVTDAFGGHGGIAQYNRDFLAALAACEGIRDVIVLPRASQKSPGTLPSGVRQLPAVQGRLAYSLAALQAAQAHPAIDVVFCGHLFMAPLAATTASFCVPHSGCKYTGSMRGTNYQACIDGRWKRQL
jgi:hypothetical protein